MPFSSARRGFRRRRDQEQFHNASSNELVPAVDEQEELIPVVSFEDEELLIETIYGPRYSSIEFRNSKFGRPNTFMARQANNSRAQNIGLIEGVLSPNELQERLTPHEQGQYQAMRRALGAPEWRVVGPLTHFLFSSGNLDPDNDGVFDPNERPVLIFTAFLGALEDDEAVPSRFTTRKLPVVWENFRALLINPANTLTLVMTEVILSGGSFDTVPGRMPYWLRSMNQRNARNRG